MAIVDRIEKRAQAAERLCVALADAYNDASHGDGVIDSITALHCEHPDWEAEVQAMRGRQR
jgi:hypothetical protein